MNPSVLPSYRRPIHRRAWFRSVVGIAVATAGGGVYSTRIEPGWIDINTIPVRLPHLDAAFAGYRIVQLSDIHIDDDWMDLRRLAAIVQAVNTLKPDLVVITGDFVTGPLQPHHRLTARTLEALAVPDGTLAVLGNHDYWTDADAVQGFVQENGINVLLDAVHTIRRGDALLHIAGLRGLWQSTYSLPPLEDNQERLHAVANAIPDAEPAVMLVHEPDIADMVAATQRFGLQLSGHSHGGQVRVPVTGAILLPPLGQKYSAGLVQIGSMQHYTHRGLGMIAPQVRFNCRPEIALFRLEA